MTDAAPPRRMGRPPLSEEVRAARAAAKAGPRTHGGAVVLHERPLAALAGRVPDVALAAVMECSPSAIRKLRARAGLDPVGDEWAHDAEVVAQVIEAARAAGPDACAIVGRWVEVQP